MIPLAKALALITKQLKTAVDHAIGVGQLTGDQAAQRRDPARLVSVAVQDDLDPGPALRRGEDGKAGNGAQEPVCNWIHSLQCFLKAALIDLLHCFSARPIGPTSSASALTH